MSETPQPWLAGEAKQTARLHAPATARNREPIAAVLREVLPAEGLVLELASGSGEHIVHFARLFPHLAWQPSDPDAAALGSIAAWSAEAGLANLAPPLRIDVEAEDWGVETADAILCINMVHISPWSAAAGLMRGAARLLSPGGPLYLYGPYIRADVETAPSNMAFDQSLRARNPQWGLRHVDDIVALGQAHGLTFERMAEMPANNLSLIFRKAAMTA